MALNIVLVVLGLMFVLAGQLFTVATAGGRRLRWNERPPVSTVLSTLGIACLAWGATQLQVRHLGGWAWLVLIPLAAAVVVPVWWHNRSVAAAAAAGRG